MELEVTQLSKVEKSTDRGIVMVYKAMLKGSGFVKNLNNGETQEVLAKVQLECDEPALLDCFIQQVIGDRRLLTLSPVNQTLDKFQTAK